MPKTIVFDWDGTLVDTLDFVFKAHNHVRSELGEKVWTPAEFKEQTKFSSVKLYPIIYGDRAQAAMDILARFMNDNHLKPENLVMLEGTREFLSEAQKHTIPMAVVSNKRDMFVKPEVDHMGLRPYFHTVVGAGVTPTDKPSAAPLLYVLDAMGVTPGSDVWMVGDTETDILCARAAGCTAVLLDQGKDHGKLIADHNPEIIARDMVALHQKVFSP